jgi:hypothetical protein
VIDALAWVPGWLAVLLLVALVLVVMRHAMRQVGWTAPESDHEVVNTP